VIVSVALILGYTVFYGVVHSWLASQRMKDWARRTFGRSSERWYRLVYNLLAGLWLALLGQLVAALGILYGLWQTNIWHFLGLCQLFGWDVTRQDCQPPLVVRGLYRWVRHPLYFLGLVLIWLTPQMTVNRLALFAVFSVYLYVGTLFEERRLLAEFGDAYRAYQHQVPRLIPWRGPVGQVR
jgi:protein-S-isoprenylcysteine O-methyltransferase Ste14